MVTSCPSFSGAKRFFPGGGTFKAKTRKFLRNLGPVGHPDLMKTQLVILSVQKVVGGGEGRRML